MSDRSLIRKNQLHPDISDLVSGYGNNFFTTPSGVNQIVGLEIEKTVQITGNQTVNGIKNFISRPTVNGTGVLLIGEDIDDGGGGFEYVFPSNLTVRLTPGKTFGKYQNGDTILASGKTTSDVIRMAIAESIAPTVNLNSSTVLQYGQTNISNQLTFSYVINTLGATVSSVSLEWKRANETIWTTLSPITNSTTSFTHNTTNTIQNANAFNYRYIVTDSQNNAGTGTFNISIPPYLTPTLSNISIGSTPALRGATTTNISSTITRNSPLITLQSYQLQFQTTTDNISSSWQNINASPLPIFNNPSFFNIPSTNFDGSTNRNIDKISYRVLVTDLNGTSTLSLGDRNFIHGIYFGYSPLQTLTTINSIEQLFNVSLDLSAGNGKSRTITNVTAGVGLYTYYCYFTGAGDLTNVIQDGAAPVLGAFQKQADLQNIINSNGATVSYRVYRSVDPQAFNSNTLTFS